MGLDACVYCNCFERGELRSVPRPEWNVYLREDGSRATDTDVLDELISFDAWNLKEACAHERGELLHHRIGNIATVAFIRTILDRFQSDFPIILTKVVYNGSHCCDFLKIDAVRDLSSEIVQLMNVRGTNSKEEQFLRTFEHQLRELTECALQMGKPIAF